MIFIVLNSSDTSQKKLQVELQKTNNRKNISQMLNKKGVLGNCAKFTEKHLRQRLL